MDEPLFKLGSISGEEIAPVRYTNTFGFERTRGVDRLRISAEEAPLSLLWKLAFQLTPPFFVLYVLHTSRCGHQLGRYQSPLQQFEAVNAFMAEFCSYLTDDGRHDLWLHSPGSNATLVWDRHDLIYAYGPLNQFLAVLEDSHSEGNVAGPPDPHVHVYHPRYDESERKILKHFAWHHSPLTESERQF